MASQNGAFISNMYGKRSHINFHEKITSSSNDSIVATVSLAEEMPAIVLGVFSNAQGSGLGIQHAGREADVVPLATHDPNPDLH